MTLNGNALDGKPPAAFAYDALRLNKHAARRTKIFL